MTPPRKTILTAAQWAALSPTERAAHGRSLEALSLMRSEGLSLAEAAKLAGTSPETVRLYAGEALTRDPEGRITATPSDRLYRRMRALTRPDGPQDLDIQNSRDARRIGLHWNAVKHLLATGDERPLAAFKNVRVRGHQLETDPDIIEAWARRGELDFEDIYDLTQ